MRVVVTAGITVAYRPLIYITFDEIGAKASGLSVTRYDQLLTVLTAVVVGAMQIMGVLLVVAMLVVPVAATSSVWGFKRSILAAIGVGQLSTLLGVTISYQCDIAADEIIVLVATAFSVSSTVGGRFGSRQATDTDPVDSDSQPGSPTADGGRARVVSLDIFLLLFLC